ncbi:MAG TPA: hypothetical protein VF881_14625 [Polyangiaceae bacterium]
MRITRKFPYLGAFGVLGFGLVACSDSAPPAPQGAISVHLQGSLSGGTCSPGAHWVNAPFNKAGTPLVDATTVQARAVDGENQMAVNCSVKPSGDKFSVNGEITSPAVDANNNPVDPTIIHVTTTIGAGETAAKGSISLSDERTGTFYSSSECTVSVVGTIMPNQLAVEAGKIWARITCLNVIDPSNNDPGTRCEIDSGYFVLENCDTGG